MLKVPISDIRKRYIARLVGRCIILLCAFALYLTDFESHDILQGVNYTIKCNTCKK